MSICFFGFCQSCLFFSPGGDPVSGLEAQAIHLNANITKMMLEDAKVADAYYALLNYQVNYPDPKGSGLGIPTLRTLQQSRSGRR